MADKKQGEFDLLGLGKGYDRHQAMVQRDMLRPMGDFSKKDSSSDSGSTNWDGGGIDYPGSKDTSGSDNSRTALRLIIMATLAILLIIYLSVFISNYMKWHTF